jgi:hypothetical protein
MPFNDFLWLVKPENNLKYKKSKWSWRFPRFEDLNFYGYCLAGFEASFRRNMPILLFFLFFLPRSAGFRNDSQLDQKEPKSQGSPQVAARQSLPATRPSRFIPAVCPFYNLLRFVQPD